MQFCAEGCIAGKGDGGRGGLGKEYLRVLSMKEIRCQSSFSWARLSMQLISFPNIQEFLDPFNSAVFVCIVSFHLFSSFLFKILITNCFTISASLLLLVAIKRVNEAKVRLLIIVLLSVPKRILFLSKK